MPTELLPAVTNPAAITIEKCPTALVVPALELLYQDFDIDQRQARVQELLSRALAGRLSFENLMIAHSGDRQNPQLCGVVFAAIQPGQIALLEQPAADSQHGPTGPQREALLDQLLQALALRLDQQGILFAQALRHPVEVAAGQRLDRNGFHSQGDMLWLSRTLDDLPLDLPAQTSSAANAAQPLQLVRYLPILHDRFAALVEETYQGSLDCPQLAAVRTGHQALQAHLAVGTGEPHLWRLYALGGRDVAVLLLAVQPDPLIWEIVYVGVTPTARGQGVARRAIFAALLEARAAGREQVDLATLDANVYANEIYRSLGFKETNRLTVHLRLRPSMKIP